jgi:hypothetical protein
VGGDAFAVDGSLIKADASRQKGVEGARGLAPEASGRAVDEDLAVLDDAAFGAATEVVPQRTVAECSEVSSPLLAFQPAYRLPHWPRQGHRRRHHRCGARAARHGRPELDQTFHWRSQRAARRRWPPSSHRPYTRRGLEAGVIGDTGGAFGGAVDGTDLAMRLPWRRARPWR